MSSSERAPRPSDANPSTIHITNREELNRALGDDMMPPMTEIHSIPCAGVRIPYGELSGLMAWRFVIQLDHSIQEYMFSSSVQAVVITNFILDTGSKNSYVPAKTLAALDYLGTTRPGTEVLLRIQGVPMKCIVAHPGDAGRVGISFMNAGSLTYYFDTSLVAPVLYDWSRERPADVPRTISVEDLPRKSRLGPPASKILSLIGF
ncbi:hypothetical protein DFH09DRAFT_1353899 [Mycena vulgaris]|nr:hypothetical protein DFH09DRAFT_1353899 [Mycena vulgaris]